VTSSIKPPWYVDLLNLNLNHHDLEEARRRIGSYLETFASTGARITENLDFNRPLPRAKGGNPS
jgi:malate synthase